MHLFEDNSMVSRMRCRIALFLLGGWAMLQLPQAWALDDASTCTQLHDRQPVVVETTLDSISEPCFLLPAAESMEALNITAMSEASYSHQLHVYELRGQQSELLGRYDSNELSLTEVSLPANAHTIAVAVQPTQSQIDKRIVAQYLRMGSATHLVVEIYNQP